MPSVKPTGIHLDFGIFDSVEWSEERAADIYENRLELAEFADRNDFYAFHLVEHHTTPLCIAPSPGIFLSAIAQRTSRIRIGPLGFLLPFHNPLRLYHEICMLDHLCQGRLELGFARGVVPMEAERFGLPGEEERRDMMREALEVLLYGFNNETLDFEGKYYNYSGIKLWLKPYQDPYPPLWYPNGQHRDDPVGGGGGHEHLRHHRAVPGIQGTLRLVQEDLGREQRQPQPHQRPCGGTQDRHGPPGLRRRYRRVRRWTGPARRTRSGAPTSDSCSTRQA